MKNSFNKAAEWLKANKAKIINMSLVIALCIVFGAAILWVVGMLIRRIVAFVEQHYQAIILIILAIGGIASLILGKRKPTPQPQAPNDEYERQSAERTYNNIAWAILPVIEKLARVYPLVTPSQVSEITTPGRAQKRNEIWYYPYALVKNDQITDVGRLSAFSGTSLPECYLTMNPTAYHETRYSLTVLNNRCSWYPA